MTDARHLEPVEVDATVVPVGTFAAGQSVDGRYVAVTAAPQGDFAEGQAEEDEAIRPEAAEASAPTQPDAPTEPSGARRQGRRPRTDTNGGTATPSRPSAGAAGWRSISSPVA